MENRIYNTLIILGFAAFLSINATNTTGAEIQKVTQNKNTIEQQIKSQLIPFNEFYTSKLKINIPISETHIEDIKETEQIENADINSKINKEENEETIKDSENIENNEESHVNEDIFTIPDGTYNYCPSVIDDNGNISMFYCSNIKPYKIIDNICFSETTINNNDVVMKNRTTVLSPSENDWDSVHVCDPSVISGNFTYQGNTYKYLMAYLGCNTLDNQKNQIGFAISNSLSSGWIKINSNPIIKCNYDSSKSDFQWGIGQPSLINLDNNGHVLLFYTEGTYNLTSTKVQELNLSYSDNIEFINNITISNKGTNDFISNADFAIKNGMLYMACDKHPFSGNILNNISDSTEIYICSFDGDINTLQNTKWEKEFSINKTNTGYSKNHNSGFYKTLSGNLAENSIIYTSAIEESNFSESLWTYRLKNINW